MALWKTVFISTGKAMDKAEKFYFSPLQPSLLVIASPAFVYFFADPAWVYALMHSPLVMVLVFVYLSMAIRTLRITIFMLLRVPAVILTDETITVTAKGDTIYWTDISDVLMANDANPGGGITMPRNRYAIIKVREPEKYLKAIKNPLVRFYRWHTRNWRLSSFEVNLSLVTGDDDELFHRVLAYYQHYRGF
jgi:hypothetical protein